MSFAVRPIGMMSVRLDFIGAGALSLNSDLAYFPETARAGDLAVFGCSVPSTGSPPVGWPLIDSGAPLNAYKVCAGGESSVVWTPTVSGSTKTGKARVLLFRPTGGAVSLTSSYTENPPANKVMSAGASPSVIVAVGARVAATTWAPVLTGDWDTVMSDGVSPSLYIAWRSLEPGESTGTMRLDGAARQTFGIWGIT